MDRIKLLLLFFVAQGAHVVASLWMLVGIIVGSKRTWRILVAYDRLGNAATGGSDRETISSRAHRGATEGRRGWCILCRALDWLHKDHCRLSDGT
jgi:hypothetical protein